MAEKGERNLRVGLAAEKKKEKVEKKETRELGWGLRVLGWLKKDLAGRRG